MLNDAFYDAKYELWIRGEGSSSGENGGSGVGVRDNMGHSVVFVLMVAVAAAGWNKIWDSAAVLAKDAKVVANISTNRSSSLLSNGIMSNLPGVGPPWYHNQFSSICQVGLGLCLPFLLSIKCMKKLITMFHPIMKQYVITIVVK
eukprot:2444665-Ditylum_brightwellii.AAC.1